MSKYVRSAFTGLNLILDGNIYEECIITGCELQFLGTAPVTLTGCTIHNCNFRLGGNASLTVDFLKKMFNSLGLSARDEVLALFDDIPSDLPSTVEGGSINYA